MILFVETPMIEPVEAPYFLEESFVDLTPLKTLYGRLTIEEMNLELTQFHLEQEELARLEEERRQEEARIQEEKRLEQERLERERLAMLKPSFNPYDVTQASNVNSDQFYQLLANTGLSDVAWVFSYAEKEYGINGLFLAGLVALESGWGNSERAIKHNNMTGYGINSNAHVVKFENRSDSILATAKLLATHYIPTNGKYHSGVSIWGINEKYCAQSDWADKIVSIANKLLYNL